MPRDNMSFEEDVIDRLARIEEAVKIIPDHEVRVRLIERRQNYNLGIASVLSVIGGGAASFLLNHLKAVF